MLLSEIKANHTETTTTKLGGMLELCGPAILHTWKLRARETKGSVRGHMEDQWPALSVVTPGSEFF